MSPSSTAHGGQHDTKYVTFELLLHAAFVADEIWGYVLEPARIYYLQGGVRRGGLTPALAPHMLIITEDVGKSRP